MKVTVKFAHEIQNRLQVVVGFLELALGTAKSKGESAGHIRRAKAAALEIGEARQSSDGSNSRQLRGVRPPRDTRNETREKMKLDGRDFSEVDHSITAAQNDYIVGHLRAAGALEALAGLDPSQRDATTIEKPAADFVTRIYLTGRKSFILAGLLTESGKTWTRVEADRNAAKFDQITDVDEISAMAKSIAEIVVIFFQSAGRSLQSSPKSSNRNGEGPGTENADPGTSASSVQ